MGVTVRRAKLGGGGGAGCARKRGGLLKKSLSKKVGEGEED